MRLPSYIVLMLTLLACYFAYITGVAKLVEAGIAFFIVFSVVSLEEICVKLKEK
ncbi:hypothetical protein [Pediococcus pentosaceus]|uniref:hypothetical protein n=1 Tax=Pediococcus pentosaceus TaxID=1255 RepID=UPI0018A13801|nr:hypothetical protein [Pediococcus pentosaceus]MBF7109914.1 hypothetical protein [Pediococcus pentosaceus]MBF7122063.1 hypothetical protein [Pediococcus pentosaceus]